MVALIVKFFARYSGRNLSSPIKANLHFSLSRSGVLSLDRAEAVVEISEWVEVPKKKPTLENSTNAAQNASVESGSNDTAEESMENTLLDDGGNNKTTSSEVEQGSADLGTEKKLKKRTYRVPLKVKRMFLH